VRASFADCCTNAKLATQSCACFWRSLLCRSSFHVAAGIEDASRSLNREGAEYSWRIFEVKCPEYTLFEVVPLELVLLMREGKCARAHPWREVATVIAPEIAIEIANLATRV
jgi:hypothetical protein